MDSVLETLDAMSPTDRGRVGSGYGERTSSRTGRRTFHAGWDFVAPRGTPIFAADDGVVVLVARNRLGGPLRGYGNAVVVYHAEDDTYVLYAHLDQVDVEEGQQVHAGQQIGRAGNTTNGKFPRMPPHLHLEVRRPKEDGSIPFPARYGRYNLDPADWFAVRGMRIGNRWRRPPGTLIPEGERELDGLESHGLPWWTTVFPEAPPDARYEPPVQQSTSPLWDWGRLVAGVALFQGAFLVLYRRLPIVREQGAGT